MDAGTVHGIDVGDEFTLYDHPRPSYTSSPLNIFVVRVAHPFRSIMVPLSGASRIELLKPVFALQSKAGNIHDLPVYVAEHSELVSVFDALAQETHRVRPDRPRILRVEKEKAMLTVDISDRKTDVVFDIRVPGERVLDEFVALSSCNWQRIPFSIELEASKVHPILDGAAHFYWHLSRIDRHHNLQNKIRFEFTEMKQIEGKYDDDLNPVIEPIGDNLNQNGSISLIAGTQAKGMYGIKVNNNSTVPLYGALFYFNTSDLSISACPAGLELSADQFYSLSIALSVTFT
jgi:hypothetical protein